MHPRLSGFRVSLMPAVLVACLISTVALAQSTNRQIGTQFEVTADQLVPRPAVQPCKVSLFTNYQFAFFSTTTQTYQFTPPANCVGPWKKVVFEMDFSENGGVQFDRTASLYMANTNLYFGTTPEPLATLTNTWHIERDVTDYSALFAIPQQGAMVLQNCTTDCPAPYNTFLNGVFTVSADLEFYPATESPASAVPDEVLPLVQSNGNGGANLPAFLFTPSDQFSTTFTLPTNIERVYLDVVSQSQSTDEQWYACLPNDVSGIGAYGCGNTDFRETEVTIDGKAAGIAPVSPWVYTGFLPDQWVPMPGAQTLDFVPYRVNLTPFAAMLNDGNPHTVALSVFNDDFYFSESASLLLYLDKGSAHVTGGLTKNTLTAPSPVASEHLKGTSTITGTVDVTQNRQFEIGGYVNTSHGKVSTLISEQQKFHSTQMIDVDAVNFTFIDQNANVQNSVSITTVVNGSGPAVVTKDDFSFPITVDLVLPVSNSTFGLTVVTGQTYQADHRVSAGGNLESFHSVTNKVEASDVTPAASSQDYTSYDSDGSFYHCQIASANNTLTSVSQGCKGN